MTYQIVYTMGMHKCIYCNKTIPRYDKQGRKLSKKIWEKRKYCSRECADKYRKENSIGWYGINWRE